jgi:3-methyladenine DNA glycosylase AlkD
MGDQPLTPRLLLPAHATPPKKEGMTLDETMRALESAGSAQTRAVYARHGIGASTFGVSYPALAALAKRIKRDQPLAESLWETRNHDARVLATMVADPRQVASRVLDAWARSMDNTTLASAIAKLAARTPFAREKADRWSSLPAELVGQAGWDVICQLALHDRGLPDDYFEKRLATIEKEIHGRKNRIRHAMNNAVISIGMRNAALRRAALAAAERIGPVKVDHGETDCRTPDAAASIARAAAQGAGGHGGTKGR